MRTLVVRAELRLDGAPQPEYVVERRVPWPEDLTLEELMEAELTKACRQLHAPKLMVTTV